MPSLDASPASRPVLIRALSLVPTTSLIVTNVIGTGVFVKARAMTCNVGTPGGVLLAYALAGLFTLAGALTFAELATLMPRAGGQYNFIGAGFGRLWAFLYGWMETLLDGAASVAAIALVFVIFLNDLLQGALSPLQVQLFTCGTIVAVCGLTLASIHANGAVAAVVTALKILLVVGIGCAAFVMGDGTWAHWGSSGAAGACSGIEAGARGGIAGFGAAVVGALWSFNGWETGVFVAEEVQDPARTLPRALIGGTLLIIALYLFMNAGFFFALSPRDIADVREQSSVAGVLMVRLLGATGAAAMTLGLLVSTFGCLHSTALGSSRVPFAMARDGLLPRAIGRVSPNARVPVNAVILLGLCALVFALSDTFDVLTDMIVFALLLFNGLAVAAIYVLRRRLPDAPRPYRVWGYPVVPALFLLATVYLMVNTLWVTPGRALVGMAIVAAGLPVYFYYARRLPADRPDHWLAPDAPGPH